MLAQALLGVEKTDHNRCTSLYRLYGRASGRFNPFLALVREAPRETPPLTVAHVFDIHSHLPSPPPSFPAPQRDLFWLHELCP